MGILAILIGDFGEFQLKVLLTTLTISAASLCGVCCGAALEIRSSRGLPMMGIFLAGIAAMLVISAIWLEPHAEAFWKTTSTISIFAFALSHLSLLSLARLTESYEWAMRAAYIVVLSVACLLAGLIFWEPSNEVLFRSLGVLGVLDGAITVLIPIFHRLSRADLRREKALPLAEIDREIAQLENRLRELKAKKQAAESQNPTASVSP